MNIRIAIILISTFSLATVFFGCSSERNNPIAKTFHNTTSHYNAYYIAREKLSEAEFKIEQSRTDNYNEILEVYHPMDEDISSQLTGMAEEAIKKASLPIQYHKNSKWVDDCYILIGRARFYKRDFPNAIQTFKYVNSKSEDENARHIALSWLLRSFIESGELNNARSVSDYLKKQALEKKVITDVTMARADYFMQTEEFEEVIENLEIAVQYIKPKRMKARLYFILGQIYQELGEDEKAYNNYKLTLKSNPTYDLSFYSKLYLAQVTRFNSDTDLKEIKKYFEKLLKDRKNEDYKDKIYYELARFERKQNNIDKTVDYLKKSISASQINPNQKAYSYLMMAEVYYENLQQYETSKAYYDSTLQTLSAEHKDYENIKRRHEILIEFTKQLAIIQYEDSVQTLAKMDSTELISFLDNIIKEEEERKRIAREKEERAIGSNELRFGDEQGGSNSGGDQSGFYFYNMSAVSIGQTEFNRIWGKRLLEDNWRRSNKGASFIEEPEDIEEDVAQTDEAFGLKAEDFKSKDEFKMAIKRATLLLNIPFSEESLIASNKKLEDAYYNLGKIYDLNLLEFKNATETFEILLTRFPDTEYKLEVMYFLYFMNKTLDIEKSNMYKNELLNNYPNSLYAKLILDPDYLKNAQLEDMEANNLYASAYANYQNMNYALALQTLDNIIVNYPSTTFLDQAILLRIMVKGKLKEYVAYKKDLEMFIEEYSTSELIPFAKKLLKEANSYIEAATRPVDPVSEASGEINEESTPYEYDENERHFFIFILNSEGIKANEMMINFSNFNSSNFSEGKLQVSQLLLNEEKILFSVKEFANKANAMRYFDAFQGRSKMPEEFKSFNPEYLIISSKNFPLFYKSKDVSEYKAFFQENYL